MKNIVFVLVLLVLVVGGVGYSRGWFSTTTSTTDHKTNLNLSIDREKVQDDVNSLKKRTGLEIKDPVPAIPPKRND